MKKIKRAMREALPKAQGKLESIVEALDDIGKDLGCEVSMHKINIRFENRGFDFDFLIKKQ